jgi:hypothetical protein
MRNAADHLGSRRVLENLQGTISITNQYKSLDKHLNKGNNILDRVIKLMSPYCTTESELQLAKFGDRVSIIVGLTLGGKMEEKDAFDEIKLMYKDLKSTYKQSNKAENKEASHLS